jgi:hypothetical protein
MMLRMRAWIVTAGILAVIGGLRMFGRRATRRGRLDVGAVSEGWLAQQRSETFDPSR